MAGLQDELTGALIGLVRATEGNEHLLNEGTTHLILEGLRAADPEGKADEDAIREMIGRVRAEKARLVPDCAVCTAPCGRNEEYDMRAMWMADEEICSLKSRILAGIRSIAACRCSEGMSGGQDPEGDFLLRRALYFVGREESTEDLLPLMQEVEAERRRCEEKM